MRKCNTCFKRKDESEFFMSGKYLHYKCKECTNKLNKRYIMTGRLIPEKGKEDEVVLSAHREVLLDTDQGNYGDVL